MTKVLREIMYDSPTILDMFAMEAMKGLIELNGINQPYEVARQAYEQAQAMMEVRRQVKEELKAIQ